MRKSSRSRSKRVRRRGGDYAADCAAWAQQMDLNFADSESLMDTGQKLAWENENRIQRKWEIQNNPVKPFRAATSFKDVLNTMAEYTQPHDQDRAYYGEQDGWWVKQFKHEQVEPCLKMFKDAIARSTQYLLPVSQNPGLPELRDIPAKLSRAREYLQGFERAQRMNFAQMSSFARPPSHGWSGGKRSKRLRKTRKTLKQSRRKR